MPEDERTSQLAALLEVNPNPVMAAAPDGRIIYRNPATEQTAARLKITAEELLPEGHEHIVRTCFRTGTAHKTQTTLLGQRFAWTYCPAAETPSVHIYGLDLTGLLEEDPQKSAIQSALDRLAIGMLVVDERLRVHCINRAATAAVEESNGLTLDRGRLSIRNRHGQSELEALVRTILRGNAIHDGASRVLAVPRPARETPLEVLVTPHHAGDERRRFALLLLADTERPLRSVEALLTAVHGLTRTEARLAALLAQGLRPSEAADRMGVGITTVRSHLRHLFRKTSTRRQAELVRRIVAGLAGSVLDLDPSSEIEPG